MASERSESGGIIQRQARSLFQRSAGPDRPVQAAVYTGRDCPRVAERYPRAMGQPVKLSDALVLEARVAAEAAERSIASQIEFWARIGKAVESILRGDGILRRKRRGEVVPLSALLKSVDSKAGRERVKAQQSARPFPHFEQAPGKPGFLVKIEENGKRTVGRFVNREFRPAGRK